ncbi:sulfate/molybdate ABC transporter ATP-binding protein [Altericista sp. CCNU0014]|uniref:sulfate/molybdate ABC transporter ATP-binding protein n=1 Tax=Altericista sp. CCNU0014 TaxID=3082949 RepID=UPI00384C9798
MSILVENVNKHFGRYHALDNINLEVKDGGLVALLGPSGSGKSTLLRVISGLETVDSGRIYINGQHATDLDVRRRNIGFVFQHYALFKHLTIRQNIGFGLEIRKVPRETIKARVEELLELVQLQGLGDRYPSQLSGGQRQRVALARSLAVKPDVLLLDEPFGALDAKVRKELRAWLRRLHNEFQVTSVFVTHDQEEAMEVADEIVIMNQGRIEQIGSPSEVYDNPVSSFVMGFVGPVNVLPGNSALGANRHALGDGPLYIRPHDLEIQTSANGATVRATVDRVIHLGWEIQVEIRLPEGQLVTAHFNREQFDRLAIKTGQQIFIKPKSAKVFAQTAR